MCAAYIGNIPATQATQTHQTFTATASQTTFTTLGYDVGFEVVYLNGVKLVRGTDYTATNGSDIVLTTGAASGDTLDFINYGTFEVNSQNFTGGLTVNNDGATVLTANRDTSDGTIIDVQKDGATVGNIGTASSNAYITGVTRGLHFTGTAGIIPCNEAGAARDADTNLGTSSTRFKDLYLSGGVYLGGTGSANLLDDYEEGTWTVNMYDAASGGNASSAQVTGRYVKIGQQVIASFDALNNINTSGMTSGNSVYFTLPFAANSTGRSIGCVQLDNVTFPFSGTMATTSVIDSNSRATLNVSGSGTADTTIKVSDFTSGASDIVNWTLSYRTDA